MLDPSALIDYAIPPSVFVPASRCLQAEAMATSGWTRLVVEKPFGKVCARTLLMAI